MGKTSLSEIHSKPSSSQEEMLYSNFSAQWSGRQLISNRHRGKRLWCCWLGNRLGYFLSCNLPIFLSESFWYFFFILIEYFFIFAFHIYKLIFCPCCVLVRRRPKSKRRGGFERETAIRNVLLAQATVDNTLLAFKLTERWCTHHQLSCGWRGRRLPRNKGSQCLLSFFNLPVSLH